MKIVVGISGASGAIYGVELLKACKEYGVETHLIITKWARKTIELETAYSVADVMSYADYIYDNINLAAAVSSGSFLHDGMIIVPCSMKTLASIACGYAESLIVRAADVTLKENRKLILVTRETPLNAIHLENMLKLARLGVTIMPPLPAMYAHPKSLDETVLHTVGRILDQFKIRNMKAARWDGESL